MSRWNIRYLFCLDSFFAISKNFNSIHILNSIAKNYNIYYLDKYEKLGDIDIVKNKMIWSISFYALNI